MKLIKYILLGIIQGFTEPLPISSSGHIFIFKQIFTDGQILNDLNFEIFVNFGSLIAIIIIYWKDIVDLIKGFFMYFKTKGKKFKNEFKYCMLVIIGCLPIGIAGITLKDRIESILSSSILIVGISFLITAVFLYLVKDIKGKKEDNDITIKDALFIGIAQIIALIPGISRSGTTLIAALARDIKRTPALKYSFILYIPISLGTMILGIKDIIGNPNTMDLFIPYTIALIFSGIVSYFSIKWFKNIMNKGKLQYFSIYCLILSLFVIFILRFLI